MKRALIWVWILALLAGAVPAAAEDSRAIGRGLHQSENRHYTEKGYGYKKLVQMEREKSRLNRQTDSHERRYDRKCNAVAAVSSELNKFLFELIV